ncbi:MAG TPA: GNAT family N-acetyltransferase [Verrucomicrobiae bacterium]|nr:GNAT family N-acetyltransferase [Verrucomicrobiae bacterium]
MSIEAALEEFPKEIELRSGLTCVLRVLEAADELPLHEFFSSLPPPELLFLKHHVTDPAVLRDWCANIDLDRNFPLLAMANGRLLGIATLHQQLGGWKRHIGRVSVLVHPAYRQRGLARRLVLELIDAARQDGLEKVEAEFIGKQEGAIKMFGLLGFGTLMRLPDYVRDMQAVRHDYVLMGLDLATDEEYAGMG